MLAAGMAYLCLVLLPHIYFSSPPNIPTLPENPPSLFSVLVVPSDPVLAEGLACESIPANPTPSPYKLAPSGVTWGLR